MTETEKIGAVIVTAVKAATAPMLEEMGRLKALVAALEARPLVASVAVVGEKGADGIPGPQGEPGPVGEKGDPGDCGEAGPIGKTGPAGLSGLAGERGPIGPAGIPGRDGLPGVQGPQGEKGVNGLDGKDGAAGTNGRDGTLEHLKVERVDNRTIRLCFTDGTPIEGGVIKFDIPLHRGIWGAASRKAYEKGDEVTFGNQQWIACADTDGEKPGESKAWQLIARKGQDGREGKPGKDGTHGRDGKDAPSLRPFA